FRFEDRIAFELGDPVAVLVLSAKDPVSSMLQRGVEGLFLRCRPPRRAERIRWIPRSVGAAIVPVGDHGFPTLSLFVCVRPGPEIIVGGAWNVRIRSRSPAGGAHPTRVAIFRSRANLIKKWAYSPGSWAGGDPKSCPPCEQRPTFPGFGS